MKNFIQNYIKDSMQTKNALLENTETIALIETVAKEIIKSYKNSGKILIAGNGGSAADSQHIAGELVSKFYFDRDALPAIALTVDTSILTAIGNDYGYEKTFVRQVQALGNKGDIFIGISTSGNSPNVVAAIKEANKKGLISIGLAGEKSCKMDEICNYCIKVPSSETPKIQESHIMIGHILCALIEKELFENKN